MNRLVCKLIKDRHVKFVYINTRKHNFYHFKWTHICLVPAILQHWGTQWRCIDVDAMSHKRIVTINESLCLNRLKMNKIDSSKNSTFNGALKKSVRFHSRFMLPLNGNMKIFCEIGYSWSGSKLVQCFKFVNKDGTKYMYKLYFSPILMKNS